MGKFLKAVKNRINGRHMEALKDDIKSVFSQGKMTTDGFIWFFLGSNALVRKHAALFENYYDNKERCYNFEGIRIPELTNKNDKISLYAESIDLLLDRLESFPVKIIHREGPYEYKEITLNADDIVIDAGANIGVFSALASRIFQQSPREPGIVYAFEPVPTTLEILKKTAELNENITIVEKALSDTVGAVDISYGKMIGDSSFVLNTKSNNRTVQVQTTTLDSFAHENNLGRIDFIKADIEGAERLLLKGAKNVLKDYAPKIAICTYHLPDDPQVLRELILSANDKYVIYEKWLKMYAYVPGRTFKR